MARGPVGGAHETQTLPSGGAGLGAVGRPHHDRAFHPGRFHWTVPSLWAATSLRSSSDSQQ